MLEKIGLPAKPSIRGNNWVVDATHCQGCSSQFTFINRKHHCRRCGGLFCNSCTQQRMVLRGQGDSPVRICEPCKKLEEAARFELRHGYKSRAGKGGSKLAAKSEDEILNQILGTDGKESFRSGLSSKSDLGSGIQRATSSGSSSNTQDASCHGGFGDVRQSQSGDDNNFEQNETGSASPEELRQQALEEKKKYKVLKGEGKPEEALRAYKRGKELERQAEALEILIRKNRKKVLSSGNKAEIQINDGSTESGRRNKPSPKVSNEKDDLTAELRELGWSDRDLQGEGKTPASVSLEGELSSLLRDGFQKTNKDISTCAIDKTPVIAHKRKALMLKREGKLAEAKEELKRAKVLEKQLEEQELLAEAGDSDDELSAIIQSMDNDEQDDSLIQYEQKPDIDFGHLLGTADEIGLDNNFEVTNEDMEDPEMDAALKALGWTEDSNHAEGIVSQPAPLDRDALSKEILSLKREALDQKRAGNVAEAMSLLKKAKLLEKDLESSQSQMDDSFVPNPNIDHTGSISQVAVRLSGTRKMDGNVDLTKDMDSKVAPKTKLKIQRELLALKKKALALRREGRLDEAEEELKKGKALERQLEEMDNATKMKATGGKDPILAYENPVVSRNLPVGEGEDDVTDQDMHDPAYLETLRNLGWNDEDNELGSQSSKPSKIRDNFPIESSSTSATSDVTARVSRRSKAEIQRELLGLKRKALSLRRQGKTDEAEEVLKKAKVLEVQMEDMEAPKKVQVESNQPKDKFIERPLESAIEEGDEEDVTEKGMNDPSLISQLENFGWKNEELEPVTMPEKPPRGVADNSLHYSGPSVMQSSLGSSVTTLRRKGEIQRELLGLKRKALALRRKGETGEAEELLNKAKVLEAQMEELEAPKDKKSGSFESLVNHEKHRNLDGEVGVNIGPAPVVVVSNDKAVEASQVNKVGHLFLGEVGPSNETDLRGKVEAVEETSFIPPASQTENLMDLLTGDDWTSSQIPPGKLEDEVIIGSDTSSLARSAVQLDALSNLNEDLGSRNEVKPGNREEMVHVQVNPHTPEPKSVQASTSENQTSLRQEVLAHKRKAVALKREGKLIEAREELRQAKLLERNLDENNMQTKTSPPDVSITTAQIPSVGQKQHDAPNLAAKPLSSRDRFKLQQESLSHKRQALKLRREGRTDEAEAEFELAKNLEAQLEEHDSKSSVNETEPGDDVGVEDLLDPQLLSALKAIGIADASIVSQRPEKPEPVKATPEKSENSNHDRSQLEERIKAEKVKAVNLKRSGKQAEALDALRRAKMYEKKLSSLASS